MVVLLVVNTVIRCASRLRSDDCAPPVAAPLVA
jgi:hypothetical protein